MDEHDVCKGGWKGTHSDTVRLRNHTKNQVTVSADSSCEWPFPKEDKNGFPIDAKGWKDVVLADDPYKTYCYNTKGCPDDRPVNPKTVIIA
jgi:hypothetical protein